MKTRRVKRWLALAAALILIAPGLVWAVDQTMTLSATGPMGYPIPVTIKSIIDQAVSQASSAGPAGPAAGDLGGSYPNPSVQKINGSAPAAIATSGSASDLVAGTVPSGRLPGGSTVTVSCANSARTVASQYSTACTAVAHNDDVAINAAIASLASGGTVQLLEGTYYVGAHVAMASNTRLVGAGRGATTIYVANAANDNGILLSGVSNVLVRALTVQGNYANQTSTGSDNLENGIRIDSTTNVLLEDVEATGAYAHGIFVNDTVSSSTGLVIDHAWVHDNGQIGLHVHGNGTGSIGPAKFVISHIVDYHNSQVASVPYNGNAKQYGGVFITYLGNRDEIVSDVVAYNEPGSCLTIKGVDSGGHTAAQNILIANVIVAGCGTDAASSGNNAGVYLGFGLLQATLSNIVAENNNGDGLYLVTNALTTSEIHIQGGQFNNNGANGINLASGSTASDITIEGAQISGNTSNGILGGINVPLMVVRGNDIEGNTLLGANLANNVRYSVIGNRFNLNAGGGLKVNTGTDFVIADNLFNDDTASSSGSSREINVLSGSRGSITSNDAGVTARTSTGVPIFVDSGSANVSVVDNTCHNANTLCIQDAANAGYLAGNHGTNSGALIQATSASSNLIIEGNYGGTIDNGQGGTNNTVLLPNPNDYQTPSTGFSITVSSSGITQEQLNPAGTLSSGTVTMPAKPWDGQLVRIMSSQIITSLTVSPNSGQTINGGLSGATLAANAAVAWSYNKAQAIWFRAQ